MGYITAGLLDPLIRVVRVGEFKQPLDHKSSECLQDVYHVDVFDGSE